MVCLLKGGWVFVDSGAAEVADEFELFVSALEEDGEGLALHGGDVGAATDGRAGAGEDAVRGFGVAFCEGSRGIKVENANAAESMIVRCRRS